MWYQSNLKARVGDYNSFYTKSTGHAIKSHQINNRRRSLLFSGTSKDPEEYLQWESDMENWLQSHKLSKAEKLAQAVSALTRKAREWWLKEITSTTYKKPVLDWRDLKARMHEEFVERYQFTPMRVTSTSSSASIITPPKPPIIKGENYGVKPKEEVKDDVKVLLVKNTTTNQELDLRSNPVKGGEDGVILISLNSRDKGDPFSQIPTGREGDICPMNQVYQPNQEDLSNESTFYRNLTHQGVTEKKNGFKIFPHEEDIQLSIRHTSSEPELDQRLLKEGFRSNRDEPSYKPTWYVNLTHQRYEENWIHCKIHYGLEVIQFLNQEMPSLPYLEAHEVNHLLDRLWRPGASHNHSGGTYKHPGRSFIILEGLDLRTNPFKGGGDGVILDRSKPINHQLSLTKGCHVLAVAQEEQITRFCQGPEPRERVKPNKKALCALCWTWPRKKRRKRPWRRQRQPKPKLRQGERVWPMRKRQWAYGKAQRSNGSEEESKAREAKPPDGPNVDNNLCMDLSPIRSLLWLNSARVG